MTHDSKNVPTFFRDLKGTRAMKAHNRNTATVALECVALGLPVVDVHSIDDNGECTCQYGKEKRAAEGRPPIAPCTGSNRGKHPKGLGWEKGQTLDPEHIAARWTARPGYLNVGVVFGAACGVALVDVDGPVGMATAESWQASGLLPRTLTVVTGSGGLHLYYRVPPGWDIRNSVKKGVRINPGVGPGLDVRGENGFAVGPCSRHAAGIASKWQDGVGLYRWKEGHAPSDGQTIADAPELLLRKMWFVTKERRHLTAPDGSGWGDAGLVEQAGDDVATTTTDEAPNPFAQAAHALAGSSGAGWQAKIALIGHGEGLADNFDDQINEAGNSYFGTYGYESEADTLKVALLARIAEAPEKAPGHRDRYLSDAYLDERIAKSRTYVKSKGGEATKAKGPTDDWPIGFCAIGDHLYYLVRDGDKMKPVKMCTRFEVIGRTNDETGESAFGMLFGFTDKNGKAREIVVRDDAARSDTGGVIATLSNVGFWIDNTTDAKAKFLTLLGRLESDKVVTIASRPGWHGRTFLTPQGKPHGADLNMRLADVRKAPGAEWRRGTFEGWQSQAADILMTMDYHGPVILCAGIAGVIVDLLKHDTCGIAPTGLSSAGKSICQKFSATWWGDPLPRMGVLFNARASGANGLELAAERCNGTCLHLDELKGAKAEQLGEIIMTLAAGVSKLRQDGRQGEQAAMRWNTYFTMSAEESVRELIEQSRGSYVTGYGVRAVDFDTSDATKFECPEWVETLKDSIGEHWGWAGPAFVNYLFAAGYVDHPEKLADRLAETTTWILDGASGGGPRGRAAGVLAYALLAGEIAQEAGILPCEGPEMPDTWRVDDGLVRSAFRKVWLKSWGSAEGTAENSPETAFTRLQGMVAQEWHLHAFDAEAREDAETKDYARPGDGEPKLGKWFHHGDRCIMKDANGAYTVPYVAVTTESFRYIAKTLALGVKTDSLIRWAAKTGKLIPRDAEHLGHLKLAGYGAVPNFRFHLGVFGPGGDDQDDDGPLSDPYRQAAREVA